MWELSSAAALCAVLAAGVLGWAMRSGWGVR